jgi:hypothetical protein
MERNVGHPADKIGRLVIGIALLAWSVFGEGDARWIGLIGIVPIATAVFGWCPGWAVLGISTVKKN